RAAIGLCRLATEAGLEIDVKALVARDLELLTGQNAAVKDDPSDVWEFTIERLEGLLDVPVEFVRAARASGLEDIGAVAKLAEAPAGGGDPAGFPRAHPASAPPTAGPGGAAGAGGQLDPKLAAEPAEVALVEQLSATRPLIEAAVAERDFAAGIAAAAEL